MKQKVIDLRSMLQFKDPKSVAEAILDEDFKIKNAKLIANAVCDKKQGYGYLSVIQRCMPRQELAKIAMALDYYGYMYRHTIRPFPMGKEKYNEKYRYHEKPNYNKYPPVKKVSKNPLPPSILEMMKAVKMGNSR